MFNVEFCIILFIANNFDNKFVMVKAQSMQIRLMMLKILLLVDYRVQHR